MVFLQQQLLCKEITKPSNIQITYDLLGEIVKYSKINIINLVSVLEKYGWENTLIEHISLNVVDSNVFLRALLLSFRKFDYMQNKQVRENFFDATLDFFFIFIFSKKGKQFS